MHKVAEKIADARNAQTMLRERGTVFGYNIFGNGFCGLKTMGETGYLGIFDTKHSVQQLGNGGINQ